MNTQTDLSTPVGRVKALFEGKQIRCKGWPTDFRIHANPDGSLSYQAGTECEVHDYRDLFVRSDWAVFIEPISDKDRADQAEERLRKVEEFLQNLHPMPNEFAYKILSGTFQDLLTIVRGT